MRQHEQQVESLLQKLTTGISPVVQVEWYIAGFPKDMGFYIRQSRLANLREATEAAQNYENSYQSLRESLKRNEMKDAKSRKTKDKKKKESESKGSNDVDNLEARSDKSIGAESEL